MNTNTHETLDPFEAALLSELRDHVVERRPAPSTRSTRRRRISWAGAGALAASVVGIGLLVNGPSAAYAIDTKPDGDIVVSISRLDDADGLERALEAKGVHAVVDYDPDALPPAPPKDSTHQERRLERSSTGPEKGLTGKPADGKAPCGGPIKASLRNDAFTITLPASAAHGDQVLHITTSGSAKSGVSGLLVRWTGC